MARPKKKTASEIITEEIYEMYYKKRKPIIAKYTKRLQEIVRDYISDRKILESSKQADWDSKLVPGWSEKLKNSYNSQIIESGHYQNGVIAEYDENTSTITVVNITEPQPPIFNADPSSFSSETPLTEWIVNGKIHPLPPLGLWWKREDWDKMYYDALPYFDDIKKENVYKNWEKDFMEEMQKLYKHCKDLCIKNYWARRKR